MEGSSLSLLGIAFALLAAFFWGAYILLSAKVGQVFTETKSIALMTAALAAGTLALLPFGLLSAGITKLEPKFLMAGLGVALLSSVIPYTVELEALKQLPIRVFGVLMSLEPAIATLLGFIILGEKIGGRALAAIILVSLASIGASLFEKRHPLA